MKPRDRFLESSRTLTLLASCLLLALALIGLSQTPQLQPVRGFLEQLVAPVQRAFSQATYQAGTWIDTANNMHALDADNRQLREDVARLQAQNSQLQTLRTENTMLRQMLGFQQAFPDLKGLPASVVGRDPSGLSRLLTIDRGSVDGVLEGMAVTSPGGLLVGIVRQVTADQASVLLIDDVDSSIPVRIDRTNVDAVLQGQAQRGGRLLVQHIPQGADVAHGDLIKTSGIGGKLPKGLLLGQVLDVHQKPIDMEQEADAYALATLDSLDQVLVITGVNTPDSAPRPIAPPATAGAAGTPGPYASATPGPRLPLYPVPPTATLRPTRTPMPTATPLPSPTPTVVKKKKG